MTVMEISTVNGHVGKENNLGFGGIILEIRLIKNASMNDNCDDDPTLVQIQNIS